MKKEKIYILHGWAYSTDKWKPLIKELEKSYKVEMLKIPGLTAPLDKVWNIDNYVDWLNKILAAEKNKITLLGHSNGGLISLAYSLKFPEKVNKLILIDTTGIYHKELLLQLKRYLLGSMAKVGKMFTDSPALKKLLYKVAGEHDYERANLISRQTMRNLIKVDLQDGLGSIKIPTIIIWGKNDIVTPLKDAYVFNKKISDSKLFIIDSARHSPQITNHQEVAEIINNNI